MLDKWEDPRKQLAQRETQYDTLVLKLNITPERTGHNA